MTPQTLKLIRLHSGLSQREFANHIGVSRSTISLIEAGYRDVTPATQARVAAKFDLSENFLQFIQRFDRLEQL